ncbi:putative ribonuclease H-like domain-containing protein [Tanacetum coccineum]
MSILNIGLASPRAHTALGLLEVIEFGDSYKAPLEESGKGITGEGFAKKKGRIVAITAEDMQKRKNDVKARTTLLLALPDEHYYQKDKEESVEFMEVPIEQDDLNQKFLTSLAPEWLVYIIVWRNRDDLDTMSLDDVYNHLKVYEPEIDDDDIEEMDIKWNWALLSMRADRWSASIAIRWAILLENANHQGIKTEGREKTTGRILRKNPENLNKKIIKLNEELSDSETDLYNYKKRFIIGFRDNKIENLKSELEELNKEKESIDYKIENFENASKDLDSLLGIKKLDKDKKGLGFNEYSVVPLPPAQIYSPPKKDLSWMGLPEFVDDTVTNYSRPTPSIKVSKDVSVEQKSNSDSSFEKGGSFVHSHKKRPFARNTAVKNKVWVPTVRTKFHTVGSKVPTAKLTVATNKGNMGKAIKASAYWIWKPKQNQGSNLNGGIPQDNIDDKGYWDSGCSRHMTGNISYLSEFEPFNEGYVSFGHGGGKITGKGTIKTSKLEFENVYFVKELKYNLFSVSQICDNKNSVQFTDSECLVLGKDFKLVDDSHVLLRTTRQHNMYSIDLKNVVPHKNLTCLIAKAFVDESMLWHRRSGHLNFKTMNKLVRNNLVKGLPSKCFDNNHTCVACLKGKQHKASCKTKLVNSVYKPLHTLYMDLFGPTSIDVIMEVSLGIEKWMNSVLGKALRESLVMQEPLSKMVLLKEEIGLSLKLVLVNKSQNKTPYELFNGRSPAIGFLRPFGCHVMILNTLDHLGKFDAKGDEGYFVGYSLNSKAFRVFNKRTMKIEENLHVDFLENKPIEKGAGPNWLFDIDTLTNSMNYVPIVTAGTYSTNISGTKEDDDQAMKENVTSLRFIALPNWFHEVQMAPSIDSKRKSDAFQEKDGPQKLQDKSISDSAISESSRNPNPTASTKDPTSDQVELVLTSIVETGVPTVSTHVPPVSSSGPRILSRGGSSYQEAPYLGNAMSFENRLEDFFGDTTDTVCLDKEEADLSNLEDDIQISPTHTLRIHKDHPKN